MEDLPSAGIPWLEENVLELAKRFNLSAPDAVSFLQRDPKYALALRAFKDAAILIKEMGISSDEPKKYIAEHGWTEAVVAEFMLGSINCGDMINYLVDSGYNSDFLDEIGLVDHRLFSASNLIFPIKDTNNRVVGFTARRFDSSPKYINSQSISTYSPYKKSEVLFGAHNCKNGKGPLHIFEGQGDVITAWQHDINAISTNGTNISEKQILTINKLNAPEIIIALDDDQPGENALLNKFIPQALRNQMHPIPKAIIGKFQGTDPDEYIRKHGKDKFLELGGKANLITTVYAHNTDMSPEVTCETLIEMCSSYISPIARSLVSKSIAISTNINEAAIFARLDEIEQTRRAKNDIRKTNIVDSTIKNLSKQPHNASQILVNAISDLETISHAHNSMRSESFLSYVKDVKQEEEIREDTHPGFILRDFINIQKALRGDWQECMIIIAGDENTGKSTLADAIVYNITSEPENNAMAIIHLTDDSVKERIKKFICLADQEIGTGILAYENVAYPNWTNGLSETVLKNQLEAREKAYKRFYELCLDERIILKDARDSTDLDFGRSMLKYYRQKYPNRKIIKVTDSINRAKVSTAISDPRMAMTYRSGCLKEDAVKYGSTELVVAEFNRPMDRNPVKIILPNMKRLAEARALEFDCQAALLLYNDVHIRGENATILWRDEYGNVRPRNIICIGKNKISNWKGNLVYNLDEVRAKFTQIDNEVAYQDQINEAKRLVHKEENYKNKIKERESHDEEYDYESKQGNSRKKPKIKLATSVDI
tara:strand:+ start:11995 stop:14307 length:2313 start_codon:yes stop_codon:yes gene_type:complete